MVRGVFSHCKTIIHRVRIACVFIAVKQGSNSAALFRVMCGGQYPLFLPTDCPSTTIGDKDLVVPRPTSAAAKTPAAKGVEQHNDTDDGTDDDNGKELQRLTGNEPHSRPSGA